MSYSFILNIVILFIFVCFAIVMGILSYYRAFKANSIIIETIEKYEGFNCFSEAEIATKLNSIAYNVPFSVNCNSKGDNCRVDTNQNYAVVSYDLDFEGTKIYDDRLNSSYKCDGTNGACTTNKHYQYGVYTYMYVDFPIVSNILKLSVFGKSDILYEFRNFYVYSKNGKKIITDVDSSFNGLYTHEMNSGKLYVNDAYKSEEVILEGKRLDANTVTANVFNSLYTATLSGNVSDYNFNKFGYVDEYSNPNISYSYNYKNYFIIKDIGKRLGQSAETVILNKGLNGGDIYGQTPKCGYVKDFSI